ncbi:hypothetical protein N8457_00475 [bacterium]|nr:hypothetical protein [bacterium]
MSDIQIDHDDEKAIEMAIELLTARMVRGLRACDIEEVLDMEFDNYSRATDTVRSVIREYCARKGL